MLVARANRNRAARDADRARVFIDDAHVPHVRRPSNVHGRGRRRDHTVTFGAEMIRVDLETNSRELLSVDVRGRAKRRDGFRQGDGCATVQGPKRLSGAIVDRHRRDDATGRDLEHFDAQRVGEAARRERAKIREKRNWIGGCHAGNLSPHVARNDEIRVTDGLGRFQFVDGATA